MSTLSTVVDLAIKPEIVTFGLIAIQVPDGTDTAGEPKFRTEFKAASREKEIATAKENNTLVFEQSFSYDKAGSYEGLAQVIKDPEELLSIFNAGLKVKFNQKVVALMTEVDEEGNPAFQPVEGSFDMRDSLNEPAQRRSLSPIDKAIRTLKAIPGMSDDAINSIVASLRAQAAQ
jgi:hypothetical protein